MSMTLWSHRPQDRHFLIPDDADVPPGPFELRTVVGRQQSVEEDAVLPYEVTRDEAKAWLKEQMAEVVDEAKGALLGFLRKAQEAASPAPEGAASAADTAPEAADTAPEAADRIAERLRSVGQELRAVLDSGFAEGDVQRRRAQAQLKALADELRARGEPLREGAHDLSQRLASLYDATKASAQDPETRARHLEEMAGWVENLGQTYARHLRDLARKARTEPPTPEETAPDDDATTADSDTGPADAASA